MFGAQMAVGSADGGLNTAPLNGRCCHERSKFGGGPGRLQERGVLGGQALKVCSPNTDGEGREAVHGSHAANQRVVWDAPVDEAACNSTADMLSVDLQRNLQRTMRLLATDPLPFQSCIRPVR